LNRELLAAKCKGDDWKPIRGGVGREDVALLVAVGYGGSFTAEVSDTERLRTPNDYGHRTTTDTEGRTRVIFLMYIRALRATLNKIDHLYNSVSLPISWLMSFVLIPAWLKVAIILGA